jgi:hypothetical protein
MNNNRNINFIWFAQSSSFLTNGFNHSWCEALNKREQQGITHFLMVHADVMPNCPDWVNRLLNVMEETNADVVSTIIPIKDNRGLTSIAKDTDAWLPQRLSLEEIKQLPENFEAELINTGLMLVDFKKDWVAKINPPFAVKDELLFDEKNGYRAVSLSEDWYFSREVRKLGGKLVATRKIPVVHIGSSFYSSV